MDALPDLRGHTVVAVHAHPDDEAIFTGITLRRLADAGARTVLVVATGGERGRPGGGADTAATRVAELERSAGLLGVSRLVLLGRRDSGLPGWAGNADPRALVQADPRPLGRRIARLVEAEGAATLVYDDEPGIYGHPDHRSVHRIGAVASRLTGAGSYLVTVDRKLPGGHLVHGAARAAGVAFGRIAAAIDVAITGARCELATKRAAMLAHASQIEPSALPAGAFAETYGTEWYRRAGAPGLLDQLERATRAALAA